MHVNCGHDSESSFLSTYIHMMDKTTELDLESSFCSYSLLSTAE